MAPSRRSHAAGRGALCAALAGWAFAAQCFVSPGARGAAGPRALRGGAELRRFPGAAEEAAQDAPRPLVGLAVCAASLGLAVAMVASPVRADDEVQDTQSTIAGKISRKKKKREAQVAEAKKEERVAAAPAGQEAGGGFSISLPSFSIPNNFGDSPKAVKPADSEAAPVKPFKVRGDKVYINPSDELDLDEVPLGAPNPPLLAAFLFGPSFIYLAFWVLGSLAEPAALLRVSFTEGIPHHGFCLYALAVLVPPQQLTRLRSTANFAADPLAFVTDYGTQEIKDSLDAYLPVAPVAEPLLARWQRCINELSVDFSAPPPEAYAQLCSDGLCVAHGGWPTYGQLLEVLTRGITIDHTKVSEEKRKHWSAQFRRWTQEIWSAASPCSRQPAPSAGFNATSMRAEWEQVWAPPDYTTDVSDHEIARWHGWAQHVTLPVSGKAADWIPSFESFRKAVGCTKGAAGLDGWSGAELIFISKVLPVMLHELYDLWVSTAHMATARDGHLPADLSTALFSRRVVGIPKRDENESRPISVASTLARARLTALAPSLPPSMANHYTCKIGVPVPRAVSAWLVEGARVGVEPDLTRAHDTVDHRLAAAALKAQQNLLPPLRLANFPASYFAELGLMCLALNAQWGVELRASADDDPRVLEVTGACRGGSLDFWVTGGASLHAVRAARATSLTDQKKHALNIYMRGAMQTRIAHILKRGGFGFKCAANSLHSSGEINLELLRSVVSFAVMCLTLRRILAGSSGVGTCIPGLQAAVPSAAQTAKSFAAAAAMSVETPDTQKDEFRKYLEKNGIINQLTRVLVGLYEEPERPGNAVDYIKKYLGAPTGVDVEELRAENTELKEENSKLEAKVAALSAQLRELQEAQEE
ncbi:unnamed protein product [Prorocentrum cordatum]|uniref:Uncharacterized protein n=1 Tax=Prorocentrum cordatum TaxID=2364126 RepID=A0ABN9SPK7_9DINO|nr:unnamed protein product [Polarella glacialis]